MFGCRVEAWTPAASTSPSILLRKVRYDERPMSDKQPFIKTPRQLITVVIVAFIVPVAVIGMLALLFTGGEKGMRDNEAAVLARIRPVGNVVIAEASGPKGQMTGEQVFGQVCKTCHDPGHRRRAQGRR